MKFGFRSGGCFAIAVALSMAGPLRATTITSTTIAGWETNVVTGTSADVNFSGIQSISYPSGYSASGFTITGPDGASTSLTGWPSPQSLEGGSDASAQILISPPAGGVTALLVVLGATPSATPYIITLSSGDVFNLPSTTTTWGISASFPITSVLITGDSGTHVLLEDVSWGTSTLPLDPPPAAAPEVASIFLMGLGLVCVALLRRRRLPHLAA